MEIQLWQWAIIFISLLLSPLLLSFSIMAYFLGKFKPIIAQKTGLWQMLFAGATLGISQLFWIFYIISLNDLSIYLAGFFASLSALFLIYAMFITIKTRK